MTHTAPQSINDIKHEAGHDMNRLAQMIADLRVECHNATDAYNALFAQKVEIENARKEEASANFTLSQALDQYRTDLSAQKVIIESQQEEIAHMSEDLSSLRRELCEQAKLTANAAQQVAEARRCEAHVEREYRAFIQDKSREFELLQTELRKLDKLKKDLLTYRNECRKLIDENTQLQLQANAKWIFARPRAYVSRLRARISPVEA